MNNTQQQQEAEILPACMKMRQQHNIDSDGGNRTLLEDDDPLNPCENDCHYQPVACSLSLDVVEENDSKMTAIPTAASILSDCCCNNHKLLPIIGTQTSHASSTGSIIESTISSLQWRKRIRPRKHDFYQESMLWHSKKRFYKRILMGGIIGSLFVICLFTAIHCIDQQALRHMTQSIESLWKNLNCQTCQRHHCSYHDSNVRKSYPDKNNGIFSYLNLFQTFRQSRQYNIIQSNVQSNTSQHHSYTPSRNLASSSSGSNTNGNSFLNNGFKNEGSYRDAQLVIAGKMAVEDAPCNIAQYNLKTEAWSLTERIQLSLYNSYSGGEVYSLLANHTSYRSTNSGTSSSSNTGSGSASNGKEQDNDSLLKRSPTGQSLFQGSGDLIVVGAFDTTYRNSQVTYCSVGKWDGLMLSKVGEGLCNSALSKGMKITTAALAGPQDVYVAGSFQTQVWNGDRHEFVKIYNIAHYNAVEQVWLPLNIGQITCSWCTVTVLALAWDSTRRQLHVAGKFNAIDGRNVPAGLAIYDLDSGHLWAHPGGGLSMQNVTQDGVGTALQLDEESGVLYVMGSFERLTATSEVCYGLAAYEINTNRWTCLADSAHTVQPTGGGNMLLTPYGLMVAGKVSGSKTTWTDDDRPYTIALLKATVKTHEVEQSMGDDDLVHAEDDDYTSTKKDKEVSSSSSGSYSGSSSERSSNATRVKTKKESYHEFDWSWLPGFHGHEEPLHALANGFGDLAGAVFIAGDNLVAKWSYQQHSGSSDSDHGTNRQLYTSSSSGSSSQTKWVAVTENLSADHVRGAIMAISQMMPERETSEESSNPNRVNITIIIYCVAAGCVIGMFGAIMCNRNLSSSVFPCFDDQRELKGISLDTLTYSALEHTSITDAYQRAMQTRYVQQPHLLTIIDPQEIFLQRIIGEGTFGRVWSARWRSASVAVKEFVFAQAAVAGKSAMQQEIVEEIIGEAGMMAILRHPNVLQLFGCSLTAQAIWIVSELCSLGSLRQVLDDNERSLTVQQRINLALQVAEGMTYLHNQDPPIIHRDLKSHNIFVHETFTDAPGVDSNNMNGSKDGRKQLASWLKPQKMTTQSTLVAKIGDWGSARATLSGSRTMTHGVGTACWLAPEVIKHARSSKYSDVYGYGIVLWELATREEVYQGLETTQIIAKVANESLRPPVPQDCPWKDVMVRCWAERPQDRLEFNEVVVELNNISKEMSNRDSEIVNDLKLESVEENSVGDEKHEESPLIGDFGENNIGEATAAKKKKKKTGGKASGLSILSNVLRSGRGE